MSSLRIYRRFWSGLILALGLYAPAAQAASSLETTITVTPVAQVSLSLSATTYDFGLIDVNTSSHSKTALTLTNTGEVSVTVDKRIQAESTPAGWTAGVAPAMDTYVLYVATASVRPALGDFGAATRFGAQGNVTPLTGTGGTTPVVAPGAPNSLNLWFRLDMPTTVSTLTGRTVTVRFTATAQ